MSLIKLKIRAALADESLTKAVLKATQLSTRARLRTIPEVGDYETAREAAREVRQTSIDQAERLIGKFTENFEAAGGTVHRVETPESARQLIISILRKHRATWGVKSKSMVTEELELGPALAAAGIDAVETDLGEYIIQLAGEPPSHITAPALHRSRQSIGRLFAEQLGVPYSEDPATLTRIAREKLRERFVSAQFGISGANFLIAESGHIALVENEGNARLGLSIPPLYLAVTGMEKLLAQVSDLSTLLKLLPRSATGQRFSGYFHLLKPGSEVADGPREMHVVILDNGRRRAMSHPIFREMMLCIRCGACLNACPVYQSIGGHAYRSVYPGPMGSVISNLLGRNLLAHPELAHLSTLCGLCREVCPVRIDLPKLLLELRALGPKSLPQQALARIWQWTMMSPARFETAGRLLQVLGHLPLTGLQVQIPDRSFRDQGRE